MFFPDLSTDCQVCSGKGVRAVGWLARGKPYTQGGIQPEHVSALIHHVATAYQPFLFRGLHECELCGGRNRVRGFRNLLIPRPDRLYIAPEMIVHYVERREYKPPDEFLEALSVCPDQQSVDYFALLQRFSTSSTLSRAVWPQDAHTPQLPTTK